MKIRVGLGYDVHQLVADKPFFLGGIELHEARKGAVGHSDADVLIHAICDALLGAANLRDIGYHFPPTDPKFKGIDSKKLLKEVVELLSQKGYSISNVDATVVLEAPKVNPHIEEMQKVLSSLMKVDPDDVSIKATTSEKMGFVGRDEGVASFATALIMKD